MNKINVKLLHVTPPNVIIKALEKPYKNEKVDIALINKVCLDTNFQEKHGSVLEHVNLSFDITNFSRLELQEHSRHRIASETVESTRYVLAKLFKKLKNNDIEIFNPTFNIWDYYVKPDLNTLEFEYMSSEYKEIYIDRLGVLNRNSLHNLYKFYQESYIKRKDIDFYKYMLNEGFRTNMTWTINLRSFLNFLKLRKSKDAHFEIRYIANLCLQEANYTWLNEILKDYK